MHSRHSSDILTYEWSRHGVRRTIPRSKIDQSLLNKGFQKDTQRDHDFYYFYFNGKKTIARTKISKGSAYRDYSDSLFKFMKTQLKLDTALKVRRLLDCTMSESEYISELKMQGVIK